METRLVLANCGGALRKTVTSARAESLDTAKGNLTLNPDFTDMQLQDL